MSNRIMTGERQAADPVGMESLRVRMGLSKVELCRRIGVRTETYNGYLQGGEVPEVVVRRMENMRQERRENR